MTSTTTVVVGLGNIGAPIAARIASCGRVVIGVDGIDERRVRWQADTGAVAVASLADVPWAEVDRVLVVVRMTAQALDVLAEVGERARRDLACHVLTTLEPTAAAALADTAGNGVRVLEQPVSGGSTGAGAGSLTVLSAGPLQPADGDFLRVTIAARVVEFPAYGQPTMMKLINNAAAAYNTRTTALMLVLAESMGLDPARCKDVIDTSSGASFMGAMVGDLADEQAELLAKDVALLATVHDLPAIGITDADAFVGDVRAARDALLRHEAS